MHMHIEKIYTLKIHCCFFITWQFWSRISKVDKLVFF